MSVLVGGNNIKGNNPLSNLSVSSGGSYAAKSHTITNLSGNGYTVYGDYQSILGFTVVDNAQNTNDVISGTNVNLSGNNITLGCGTNTIYGSVQTMNFSVTNNATDTGVPNTTSTYNVGINNVDVVMGGNNISVGSGVNTIYGTLQNITMSDTGGNALTANGSQVTVNTLMDNDTIDLTGGGKGNTITAGAGVNTVFGDLQNFTMTVGGASANSDPNDPNYAFAASPNVQAFTEVTGFNFTVGGNKISLGVGKTGVNTVYGDMQTLNIQTIGNDAIGYNSLAFGGVGDFYNWTINNDVASPYFGAPPFLVTPNFNNFNFNANAITVGNGVNVIYGDLQTLSFSEGGDYVSSPGAFFATPGYEPSSLTDVYPTGTVAAAEGIVGVGYTDIIMGTMVGGNFIGNTISAGVGVNTIYGDFQTFKNGINGGTDTGSYPPTYAPFNSIYDVFGNDYSLLANTVLTMAGNVITAGLLGIGVNTIYGNTQDLNFINVAGVNNQGSGEDSAEFEDVFVFGGTGTFDTTDPGIGFYPNFIPTLTGNTITAGNGVNTIYGNMRDFITTNAGGVENGLNAASQSVPYVTINDDRTEFFMGDNHIYAGLTGSSVNTIYGSMRDFINVNGGVDNNGVIVSDASIVENVPSGGTDVVGLSTDILLSIAGNVIDVGSGVNTIYGSMRDFTWINFGGKGINISPDSYAVSSSYDYQNIILMGENNIIAGSGVNTIDGDFRNMDWSVSGGVNPATPNVLFTLNTGANISGTIVSMGDNIIQAGLKNVSSVNVISGDGVNILYSAIGGTATGGLVAWNFVGLNSQTMGGNQITVYGGGTSTIYGDVQSIDWSATGGNANGSGSYAEGQIYQNSIMMGGNTIIDNGNSADTIYGDAMTLLLSVKGGTATNGGDAAAYMLDNTLTLLGNTIQAGAGNDVIFASLENLSFSAQAGSGSGAGAYFLGALNSPGLSPLPDSGNIITFGNDTITGGAGSDFIVADDALNLTGLNVFLGGAGNLNEINWSDNTIIGGKGADNYVFSMVVSPTNQMSMQGVDIITNFQPTKGDKLSFGYVTGAATAATLDANSAFVNIHVGGTLSGTIDGVAAIFNQGLGSSVANALETAINSFIAANDPTATGLALLQDVAGYIANGLASAPGLSAVDVQGGLILEGQTTSSMGSFSAINALHALAVEHTAIAVHS